jgi:hypothetical protein
VEPKGPTDTKIFQYPQQMPEWRLKGGSALGEGEEGARRHKGRRNEYQLWDTFTSKCDRPEVEFKARNVSIKG